MKKLSLILISSLLLGACTIPSLFTQKNTTTNNSSYTESSQDLLKQIDDTIDDGGASDLQQLDTESQGL